MLSEEKQSEVIDCMVSTYFELGKWILSRKFDSSELDAFVKLSGLLVPLIIAEQ